MSSATEIKNSKTKHGIFFLFLLIILLPLLQMALPFLKEERLNGVDLPQPLPCITDTTWFGGEYQKNYETTFEQNVGFHNSLVRLNNQFNYSLFRFVGVGDGVPGKEKYRDIVLGKQNYIYLKPYINAYNGADFLGQEYITIQSKKIKIVQEALKKKNVDFFVVFAPGKGSFYSEFIPDSFKEDMNPDSTNYASYKKNFSECGVNNLDLRSYFLSIKSTEEYPLYSTTGIHWTEYGCYLAGKQIVNYIEKLRNIQLPEIKIQSVKMLSLSGRYSLDYDVANLMNIFSTHPHPSYAIPKLTFESGSKTVKPRFLCISDSYFSGIINTTIPSNVFTDYHYWLYNDGVFPESFLKETRHNKKELKQNLEKQDVVCVLSTDATLAQFPYGFINEAYEVYAPKDEAYYVLKQQEFRFTIIKAIETIKQDPIWKKQLVEQAKRKGISETDEFIANALWLYNQEHLKLKND